LHDGDYDRQTPSRGHGKGLKELSARNAQVESSDSSGCTVGVGSVSVRLFRVKGEISCVSLDEAWSLINAEFASAHPSLSDVSSTSSKTPASKSRSTGAFRYKLSLDSPFVGGTAERKEDRQLTRVYQKGSTHAGLRQGNHTSSTTKVNIFRCRNFRKGKVDEV
jgi:hypothetical protein